MQRTYCGEITNQLIKQNVLIKGWVKKNRKLGKLLFLDIRDRSGIVQVVIDDKNINFELVKNLKRESVVEITGVVSLRKTSNDEIENGDVEIVLSSITVDSIADTTPLIIEDDTDALEDTRMNYRFLDLRRPIMQQNLMFRSQVVNRMRQFFIDHGFIEVETPILGKPTPEGARDYLVPSRISAGKFYALPQSPQIYKQLLMVSGFDRYFQVAKCFRDEDLRSDRQPEFTQLDIEMSFTNELEIQTLIEKLCQDVFKKVMNIDLSIPFKRMDYDVAMNKYGSDKPDLRFGLELIDATNFFKNTEFNLFKNAISNKHVIKTIIIDKILTKKDVSELEKYARDMHAKGLAWLSYDGQNYQGSIANHVNLTALIDFLKQHNKTIGTVLFIVDKLKIANEALGLVRNILGDKLDLKKSNQFEFVWIVNWPLFEYDDKENKFLPAHHPFTQPQDDYHSNFDTNKSDALAKAYDIVLNGYELGGGSIRIIDPNMQTRMFKTIGLNEQEIRNKFGYLLDAFRYGVPPHGGIAIGIDRMISLMLGLTNIRDVIAFPKNAHAIDQMLKAPSNVNSQELLDLHLKIKE